MDYCTDLDRFMALVGATDASVADATKLSRSAVWRLRTGKRKPTGETMLRLNAWASQMASKKRVTVADRLSWDGLGVAS